MPSEHDEGGILPAEADTTPLPREARASLRPGDLLLGRYEVVRVLGRGARGEVLEVLDKASGVAFALKRLPPELARDAGHLDDVRANFALVSRLAHPNIATARHLELDPAGEQAYVLLDLVRGPTLREWIRKRRLEEGGPEAALPLDLVLGVAAQVADALDHAHEQPTGSAPPVPGSPGRAIPNGSLEGAVPAAPISRSPGPPGRGILHGDLKPTNVMVEEGREKGSGVPFVRLVDFGLASRIEASLRDPSGGKTRGKVEGTLAYMAPEQIEGRSLTRGVDQWALAVMIYEMAAGRLPFPGPTESALIHQILRADPEPPPVLDSLRWAVLRRAFEADRAKRHGSCRALVEALRDPPRSTAGEATPPTRLLSPPPGPPPAPRARGAAIGAAVILAGLAVLAGQALFETDEKKPSPPPLPPPPSLPVPDPASPSEEEARAFALALVQAAAAGERDRILDLLDADAMVDRAFEGIKVTDGFRPVVDAYRKSRPIDVLNLSIRELLDAGRPASSDESLTFLRIHREKGGVRALFRLLQEGGRVNYHDLLLARGGDGRIRAPDLFAYESGEWASETLRRLTLGIFREFQGVSEGVLDPTQADYVANLPRLEEMAAALSQGRSADVIEGWRALPPKVRRDKSVLVSVLKAAEKAGPGEYAEAAAEFEKAWPGDPALDLVLLRGGMMAPDPKRILAAAAALGERTGGDSHLDLLRAYAHALRDEPGLAAKAFRLALDRGPSIFADYDRVAAALAEKKRWDELALVLGGLERELSMDLGDLRNQPRYAEFVETPPYRAWMSARGRE